MQTTAKDDAETIWHRLAQVRRLAVRAVQSGATWAGTARVQVVRTEAAIRWTERGQWTAGFAQPMRFYNAYRWRMDAEQSQLHLAHLRRGTDRPVRLVTLQPQPDGAWQSAAPHPCGEDEYAARLWRTTGGVALDWRINGPTKNARLHCVYHADDRPRSLSPRRRGTDDRWI